MTLPRNNELRKGFIRSNQEQSVESSLSQRAPKQRLLELREYLERLSWLSYLAAKNPGREKRMARGERT
jgi:hypothetical protein